MHWRQCIAEVWIPVAWNRILPSFPWYTWGSFLPQSCESNEIRTMVCSHLSFHVCEEELLNYIWLPFFYKVFPSCQDWSKKGSSCRLGKVKRTWNQSWRLSRWDTQRCWYCFWKPDHIFFLPVFIIIHTRRNTFAINAVPVFPKWNHIRAFFTGGQDPWVNPLGKYSRTSQP